MTGQAKQTELRCEVISGAGQRQIGDRCKAYKTGRKEKEETKQKPGSDRGQQGSERWEGGMRRGRGQRKHTHTQVCTLLDELPAISPHRS